MSANIGPIRSNHKMDVDVPAAAQLSQADIIERQAETIARLQRHVKKATEYKRLTKTKLQEAAARLREYRLRVETLLQEAETRVKSVKAKKPMRNAETQTSDRKTMTRMSQTTLSGQVQRVNTKVDASVQTMDAPSRKRARAMSTQTEMDQIVPKLSRDGHETQTVSQLWTPQVLETFSHATSAELDAELAFSDSEDESKDTLEAEGAFDGEMLAEIDKELESKAVDKEQRVEVDGVSLLKDLDSSVLNEINKELESSDEDEACVSSFSDSKRRSSEAESTDKDRVDVVGGERKQVEDNAVIGSVSGFAVAAGSSTVGELDSEVSNAIDKELGSSSDEEEKARVESKGIVMSIDDELDDELAALSSSSSSSSDSDSSDSSDSDSDDPMTGNADKTEGVEIVEESQAEENKSLAEKTNYSAVSVATSITETAVKVNMMKGVTAQQCEDNSERGASYLSTDTETVVLTTSIQKKPVTAEEEMYSPVVAPESQPQNLESLQLDTSTTPASQSTATESLTVVIGAQEDSVQDPVPDSVEGVERTVTSGSDTMTSIDVQSSLNDESSPEIPASTLKLLSSNTSQVVEATVENTKTTRRSDLVSSDSRLSTAEPSETSEDIAVVEGNSDAKASDIVLVERICTIGKTRKADEAKLDESTALHKKTKVDKTLVQVKDGVQASAAVITKKSMKKTAVTMETKVKLRLKKSLTVFKQGIVLGKGEEADNEYARRTMALLVNQSSKFVDTHVDHVTTLCQSLADAYRELAITPMMAVRGALGVFRTPRSRRLMVDSKLGLTWLCNHLLIRLMSSRDVNEKEKGSDSVSLSLVDECLQHLHGLLVQERKNVGDLLSMSRVQMQTVASQITVSHDKVFLAHICRLHTHLCHSTGQLARSRVLLFDLLRDNPNICGLYLAMGMLEIYPAMLEREFDQHCMERQLILKETLQQALIAIACAAADRQELLLHQSSVTMLHRIADAIQMPELQVDGDNPSFTRSYVEKLVEKLAISCQDSVSLDYFELAKSLEICTAVFGLDLVSEIVTIERCQELFINANIEGKNGLLSIIGHIGMAVSKTKDLTTSEEFVENVIEWFHEILSTRTSDDRSADDSFQVLLGCSTVCIELILNYSTLSGLELRRKVLCAVVKWFNTVPTERLIDIPATFLRRLRLAVVAARPQILPASN